jgi:hypothetical protein
VGFGVGQLTVQGGVVDPPSRTCCTSETACSTTSEFEKSVKLTESNTDDGAVPVMVKKLLPLPSANWPDVSPPGS